MNCQKHYPALSIRNHRSDTYCTIIDNLSKDPKTNMIFDVEHERLTIIKKQVNHGKAIATNEYLKEAISNKIVQGFLYRWILMLYLRSQF